MPATAWRFDADHTSIDFRIRHAAISWVRGTFHRFDGSMQFDPSDPAGVSVSFAVDVASVDTGVPDRDEHLRSADFFDVSVFPQMTFTSRAAVPRGGDRYTLSGDLQLHGITRPVTFDVVFGGMATDPWGVERVGFEATTTLDRRDFGLVWNQTMEDAGLLVGDTVDVTITAEAARDLS